MAVLQGAVLGPQEVPALLLRPRVPAVPVVTVQVRVRVHEGRGGGSGDGFQAGWQEGRETA